MLTDALPLVGITGTLNAIVSLYISARLYATYKINKQQSHQSFLFFFLYFGIFYTLFATTQLVFWTDSGFLIGISHVISYFFLYLSLGYLLSLPYHVKGQHEIAQAIWFIVFVLNILFFVVRIIDFTPSEMLKLASYVYWQPIFAEWLRVVTGVLAVVTAATVSTFFIRYGLKNKVQPVIYKRSLWIGGGIAVLMIAAVLAFIAAPSGSAPFVFIATFLVLAGLLATHHGLQYK
jgi:hypothetical protein